MHRSGALHLFMYISKRASKQRMLVNSLQDKLFLQN